MLPIGQKPPAPPPEVSKIPGPMPITPVPVNAAEITAKEAVEKSILQAVKYVIGPTATTEQVSTAATTEQVSTIVPAKSTIIRV